MLKYLFYLQNNTILIFIILKELFILNENHQIHLQEI
jgi:hypothetical protein